MIVCVYVCVYLRVRMCMYIYAYVCMCVRICVHVCICVRVCGLACVGGGLCVCVCVCVACVQTPRTPVRPGLFQAPIVPMVPSRGQAWPKEVKPNSPPLPTGSPHAGGVSAQVEQVPEHLRALSVNLSGLGLGSANDAAYYDPNMDSIFSSTADGLNYMSSSSWASNGAGLSGCRQSAVASHVGDSVGAQLSLVSQFTSSQGVEMKTGSGVVLVRHGQRGWILVRDAKGLKSWVPEAYLHSVGRSNVEATIGRGDGRHDLVRPQVMRHDLSSNFAVRSPDFEGSTEIARQQPFPARSVARAAAARGMAEPMSCVAEAKHTHEVASSVVQSRIICEMEHEMFESWVSDAVEARTHSHALPALLDDDVAQAFVYPSDMRSLEDAASSLEHCFSMLERVLQRRVFEEQTHRERVGQRIEGLEGVADVNMLFTIQEAMFKEREEREKERYDWSVQKKQLNLAVQLHQEQAAQRNTAGAAATWHDERRQLMNDLQSERERAGWLQDRLLASADNASGSAEPSVQNLLLENQELQSALERMSSQMVLDRQGHRTHLHQQQLVLDGLQAALELNRRQRWGAEGGEEMKEQLQRSSMEISSLRHAMHRLQEQVAERDVAIATLAHGQITNKARTNHGQITELALDNKDIDALKLDVERLGHVLLRGMQQPGASHAVTIDHARLTIEKLVVREAGLLEHVKARETSIATLHHRISELQSSVRMLRMYQDHAPTRDGKGINMRYNEINGTHSHRGSRDTLHEDHTQLQADTDSMHVMRASNLQVQQLEVDNSALKQHLQKQQQHLEEAAHAVEHRKSLTVAKAVLENKYTTLQRHHSMLTQRFEHLQQRTIGAPISAPFSESAFSTLLPGAS